MNDQKMIRYSIKERLRSADHSAKTTQQNTRQSLTRSKILAPEHYNYFLNKIDREIKHESNIFKRIKRKIQDIKTNQNNKIPIKNSYLYDHKSFSSKILKRSRQTHRKINQPEMDNLYLSLQNLQDSRLQLNNQTKNTFFDQHSSGYFSTTAQTPAFKRSPVTTPGTSAEIYGNQLHLKLNQITKKHQNLFSGQKENILAVQLNVVGSQPHWRQFQCYHRSNTRGLPRTTQ